MARQAWTRFALARFHQFPANIAAVQIHKEAECPRRFVRRPYQMPASIWLPPRSFRPSAFRFVLSVGIRGTDAELWGMGGKRTRLASARFWRGCIRFQLPGKSTLTLASEASQQPHHPYGWVATAYASPPSFSKSISTTIMFSRHRLLPASLLTSVQ